MVLLLSKNDVESVLTMREAIAAVEEAFKQYALGNAVLPTRIQIPVKRNNGYYLAMPAYIGGTINGIGLKIVTVYPENPAKHGIPTIIATVQVNDPETGQPLAIMDGTSLTAVRTGAVGGVAAKYLSRSDSSSVGVFGAGVQARTQLMALTEVRPIKTAKVYDSITEMKKKYAVEMSERLGIPVTPVEHTEDAVKGSHILVTATTSSTPVFDGKKVESGTHINAIGSFVPGSRELDDNVITRAKIVVDSLEAALVETGDLIIPLSRKVITKDKIHGELGELIAGKKPGRTSSDEITVFKSVGLAIQDISTAKIVYEKAIKKGVGKEVKI